MTNYYLDSYALIAIARGSLNYKKYATNNAFITHAVNLQEMYLQILKVNGEEIAKQTYFVFKKYEIPHIDEDIFNSAEFKLIHKNKNLSYVDCLGYCIAKRLNYKFLTGDQGFERLENVEYTKQ